jgi:phosphatidate cytidylyltransferase
LLLHRLISALVGIPIVVGAIWWGPPWLTVLVAVVAVLGIREAYRLLPLGAGPLPAGLGALWAIALMLGAQAGSGLSNFLITSSVILAAGAFAALLWFIAFYSGSRYLAAGIFLVGGPVYLAFLLGHALPLRDIGGGGDLGRDWLLFALLVTFATDTGAFLTGRLLGRHAMAPGISPNKTWEGAVGGFAWAVLAAVALGLIFDLAIPRWQQAIIGAAVGVVSQLGDLFESKLKRLSQVKDAGGILPGHGGILDRLDSVVVSVPVVYYLLATVFKP